MFTYDSWIKTEEEPWSISVLNVRGNLLVPHARQFQKRWGTCIPDASIRGCIIVAVIGNTLLTEAEPELSESLISRPPITLEALGAIYVVGLRDIPRMAATG